MERDLGCFYGRKRRQTEQLQLPNFNEPDLLNKLRNIVFAGDRVRQKASRPELQAVVDAVQRTIPLDKLPPSIYDLRRRPLVYKNALQAKIDELHAKRPNEEMCDFQSLTEYEKILARLVAAYSRPNIANPQKQ